MKGFIGLSYAGLRNKGNVEELNEDILKHRFFSILEEEDDVAIV